MTRYRLTRGETVLGTVNHLPDEAIDGSPWDIGRLDPSADFESVCVLFEEEQRLLDQAVALEPDPAAELLLVEAETIQAEIMRLPVYLDSPDGTVPVTELHIQGDQVHWR